MLGAEVEWQDGGSVLDGNLANLGERFRRAEDSTRIPNVRTALPYISVDDHLSSPGNASF